MEVLEVLVVGVKERGRRVDSPSNEGRQSANTARLPQQSGCTGVEDCCRLSQCVRSGGLLGAEAQQTWGEGGAGGTGLFDTRSGRERSWVEGAGEASSMGRCGRRARSGVLCATRVEKGCWEWNMEQIVGVWRGEDQGPVPEFPESDATHGGMQDGRSSAQWKVQGGSGGAGVRRGGHWSSWGEETDTD